MTLPYSPRMVPAMANEDQTGPRLAARGHRALAARQAREAQALRENLRKRAAQRRDRAVPPPHASAAAEGPEPEGEA
ncbi:MAG TPA: hypothetical protein VGA60_14615 [Kiloniellales bacterium]|jgi:hypothetical protein